MTQGKKLGISRGLNCSHSLASLVDGGDGSMLAGLDAFPASDASDGILYVDVLVDAQTQNVDFAENLFRASLVTFPTRFAVMGIDRDVISLKLFHSHVFLFAKIVPLANNCLIILKNGS